MKMGSVIVENGKKVLTMTEYIEREALMRRIKEIHCAECDSYHGVRCRACWVDDTLDYIDSEPAADVAPVRHGRWVEKEKYTFGIMYDCSLCEARILDNGHPWNYCPNCGAKMDGGDGNSDICSKTI